MHSSSIFMVDFEQVNAGMEDQMQRLISFRFMNP